MPAFWQSVRIPSRDTTSQELSAHGVRLKAELFADLCERLAGFISVHHLVDLYLSGRTSANLDTSLTQERCKSHVTDSERCCHFPERCPSEVLRFGRVNVSFGQDYSPPGFCPWPKLNGDVSLTDGMVNLLDVFDRAGKFRKESRRVHRTHKARTLANENVG